MLVFVIFGVLPAVSNKVVNEFFPRIHQRWKYCCYINVQIIHKKQIMETIHQTSNAKFR